MGRLSRVVAITTMGGGSPPICEDEEAYERILDSSRNVFLILARNAANV